MNLPPPGTPEFEKLIHGQPKKDWTKEPMLKLPSDQAPLGYDYAKPLFTADPYAVDVVPSPEFVAKLKALKERALSRLSPPAQLDCTDLEAQRSARCLDWDAWETSMRVWESRITRKVR